VWYYLLDRRTTEAYRSSRLFPGPYENGVELPAFFIVRGRLRVKMSIRFFPWSRTVFLPFTECMSIGTEGGALAALLQDTLTVRLKGGSRLWFPTGLLGEDGLAYFKDSLARRSYAAAAPMAAAGGPTAGTGEWSEVRTP